MLVLWELVRLAVKPKAPARIAVVGPLADNSRVLLGNYNVVLANGKRAYLEKEHGPALAFMRDIKRALDPKNIMNPGKIFSMEG